METSSETVWYVLVEGQSYGPYISDVMANFVQEGRVIPASLISAHPQQGFVPASSLPIFQHWSNMALAAPAPQAQPQYQQQPSTHIQPKVSAQETLFLVMAEVDPKTGMNFLRALQSFGYVQRIGESVWMLHASHDLDDVKSALASTLTKRDRLFIHDCFANQQSWENIGADLDSRIRQIWQSVKR